MSIANDERKELVSALDQLLSKYFDEKDEVGREKTPADKFWGTYLRAMKDEDEARPKDWDGNTGQALLASYHHFLGYSHGYIMPTA